MTANFRKRLLLFLYLISLFGCTSTPTGIWPVTDFDIKNISGLGMK